MEEERGKRLLFLDDNQNRHRAFQRATIGTIVKHVYTADECIQALLGDDTYDCVFLDHDLGGKAFQKEYENSGTEVADFIANELPEEKYPGTIIIHSWNPEGAERMRQLIDSVGIPVKKMPFSLPH